MRTRTAWFAAVACLLLASACREDSATTGTLSADASASPAASPVASPSAAASVAASPAPGERTVHVFFSGDDCAGDGMVERAVPDTAAVAGAALRALLEGPTAEEQARGLWFVEGSTPHLLRALRIDAGTAYVDFTESFFDVNNVSTSCTGLAFRESVERTLTQFPTVQRVRYAVAGKPRWFYEFMQLSCPPPCDPDEFASR